MSTLSTSTVALVLLAGFAGHSAAQEGCNDAKCKVDTMLLNTGYNQAAGAPYSPVQLDGYWELVDAPNANLTVPTPAWVITPNAAWNTLPNSSWISAYNNANLSENNQAPKKPYSFQRCFCTCPGIESIDINIQMLIDNYGDVYFDNMLIGSQTNVTASSFHNPPFIIHAVKPVSPGKHCIRIDLRNDSSVAMGVDIVGTVKSASPPGAAAFLSPVCCDPTGKIIGRKFDDKNCNGKDDNENPLSGWVITATNTTTHATVTATTDAAGFYYFNNLPAGTYTIAETTQSGWSQTMPGGTGTYTVTLGANQVIQEDFGNGHCNVTPTPSPTARPSASPTAIPSATPISTGCAQVTAKEVRCEPNGGYSYTFTVTNSTGSDMSQILLTPPPGSTFTLSPQLFSLSSPLHNGQSTTLTVNIGNAKPGDKVCFFVSLMADGAPCCTTQICATMPQCGTSPTPTPTPTPADCWCCVDMPGGMGVANTTKENCTQHGVGPQGAQCFATEAAAVDYCYPVWCCTTAPDGSVSIIKTTEADCVARHNGVNGNYYPTKELAIAACEEPPGTWCCAPAIDSHGRPIHEAFPADAQQCAAQGGQLFNTEAEALASCNMCWCCPKSGSGEYFLMDATDCKNSNFGAQCFSSKAEAMACAAPTSPTPNPAQKRGRRR